MPRTEPLSNGATALSFVPHALHSALIGVVLTLASSMARADSTHPVPANQLAVSNLTGPSFQVAAGFALPPQGGRMGLLVATDARYGFEVARVVLAPGLRVAGMFAPETTLVGSMATLLLAVPASLLEVGFSAGVGPGYFSERSRWSALCTAGVQLMAPLSSGGAVGVEASYLSAPGTGQGVVFIGPILILSV